VLFDVDWFRHPDFSFSDETLVYRLVNRCTAEFMLSTQYIEKVTELELRTGIRELTGSAVRPFEELSFPEMVATRAVPIDFVRRDFAGEFVCHDMHSATFWKRVFQFISDGTDAPRLSMPMQTNPYLVYDRMMEFGFSGSFLERALLTFLVRKVKLSPTDEKVFKKLVHVKSLNEKMADDEAMFRPPLSDTIKRPEQLIKCVLVFYYVRHILNYLQTADAVWPAAGPCPDPLMGYSLLYGVHRNGLNFDGVDIEPPKPLSEKSFWRILNFLIQTFAPSLDFPPRISNNFVDPQLWILQHAPNPEVVSMTDEDFSKLFQILVAFGFPIDGQGDVDFGQIAHISGFVAVPRDVFKAECETILRLAQGELDDHEPIQRRLGQFSGKSWLGRLRSNHRDLRRIRSFVSQMTPLQLQAADAVRPWDAAPPWWRSEHDIALLQALNDFGLLYVSSWLVDVDRPFAAHVNEFQFAELSRLAAVEAEQRRVVKPRETDDLAFLFNDKTKVSRALLIVQFVENEEKKAHEQVSAEPEVEDPCGGGELPTLPWEVNGQLVVVKWGQFVGSDFQYPVGYASHRQYHSIDNPLQKAWYEAATEIGDDGGFLFRVTDLSDKTRT
jgi:chromodomain-helicase-DNA-binding protein 7